MLFRQFVNGDLGCASYLIGCESAGEAVVVDPPLAIEELLEAAAHHEVRIVRTIETHTHADHVSGHGRLALELGVPVSIHPLSAVEYPFDPLEDGDEIRVGNVSLRCLHTPGHRPEHCCIAVIDHTRAEEPWLVLTGDSLFVGDTARPDLAVGGVEGATALYTSLNRLLELSDGVEVYPGHVSGSLCGKGMSSKGSSTIGFERQFNPMLAFSELSAFVAASASVDAPKPPNLTRIVAANHGPFVGSAPLLQELAHPPGDAQLLDVRPVTAFFAGHAPGAVNVPISGSSFSTKAGFVLDAGRPVCLLADTHAEALRAARGLRSVAFLDLVGYVLGGGDEPLEPVRLDELDGLVAGGAVLLDVREESEHAEGSVAGSVNVPYHLVATAPVPEAHTLVTICETGPRACIAASVLRARGFDARPIAEGGTSELVVGRAAPVA
jgi:hydroxyacylglutathione hydrolase